MSALAKQYGIYLIAGSIPERDSAGNLYNTCLVFDGSGSVIAKHRKVHLFDIDVPGKMTFKESDTLKPGQSFTTFNTQYGKIGIGICYDIRFPEYAAVLRSLGCSILLYPGAFNTTTGPLHWELLARARAVDQQVFVAVCSPARNPDSKYQAWGHSTIISPWGKVLKTTEHQPDLIISTLDLPEVQEFRTNIPTSKQKRHDLYQLSHSATQ